MTRRQRLLATLEGRAVDRPAVSFYEIGGWKMDPDDDPFTVWNDASWRPLVELAREETDIIRLVAPRWSGDSDNGLSERTRVDTRVDGSSRLERTTIRAPGRELTTVSRRDRDVQTTWVTEHLLKSVADLEAYLGLPDPRGGEPDLSELEAEERDVGESGIVCVDIGDALCAAASLFAMGDYTVVAMTEGARFRRLLDKFQRVILPRVEMTARAFPGHMWRIYGPEYASEPYLPPRLYEEYVVGYTGELCHAIRRHGGYPRIHSHGRLRAILPLVARMEPACLEPLEPPPQGDMELNEISNAVGADTVLMGNIEASDIENLPPAEFRKKVARALREGTAGKGRGFILLPSACPYGRTITERTLENYRTMVELTQGWGG